MLNLFKVKEPDMVKIENFCDWFSNKRNLLIDSVKNADKDRDTMVGYLYEVQDQLASVYGNSYKGSIEFEYGFNKQQNKWELNLFHLGNKYLIKTLPLIKTKLESKIADTWIVNIDR